ncbi:MAG: hypothetical protein QXL86_03525 [Candidatus Aenigmatarchaeota archaeon]
MDRQEFVKIPLIKLKSFTIILYLIRMEKKIYSKELEIDPSLLKELKNIERSREILNLLKRNIKIEERRIFEIEGLNRNQYQRIVSILESIGAIKKYEIFQKEYVPTSNIWYLDEETIKRMKKEGVKPNNFYSIVNFIRENPEKTYTVEGLNRTFNIYWSNGRQQVNIPKKEIERCLSILEKSKYLEEREGIEETIIESDTDLVKLVLRLFPKLENEPKKLRKNIREEKQVLVKEVKTEYRRYGDTERVWDAINKGPVTNKEIKNLIHGKLEAGKIIDNLNETRHSGIKYLRVPFSREVIMVYYLPKHKNEAIEKAVKECLENYNSSLKYWKRKKFKIDEEAENALRLLLLKNFFTEDDESLKKLEEYRGIFNLIKKRLKSKIEEGKTYYSFWGFEDN